MHPTISTPVSSTSQYPNTLYTTVELTAVDSPADLTALRWGYKKCREYGRRLKFYRGELPPVHPAFPLTSAAALTPGALPVPVSAPDIEYSAEDDVLIDEFHRNIGA